MNRFYHVLILALIAALFTPAYGAARAAALSYPQGLSNSDLMRGVYPGNDVGSCCWMGRSAAVHVIAPMGADTMLVTVFIPDYAVQGLSQGFRVRLNGGAWQDRCCYGAGLHQLAFSLGEPLQRPQPLTVDLAMRQTFVPAKLGLNADPRELSALLRGVSFENVESGAQFAAGGKYSLAQPSSYFALLVLGAILAAGLAYWRPAAGLAALIVSDPFSFSYYVHGTALTLPKAVLLGVLIGLLARGALRQAQGDRLWLVLGALLAFIASMALSSVHAVSHGAALRETLKMAQYALTLVGAYAAYRAEPNERFVRIAFAGVTALVSVLAILEEWTGTIESTYIHGHTIARIAGPLEGPNQLAAFLGVTIPLLLAFAVLRKPMVLERFAIALGAIACVLTISRGGIAALVLATVLLLAVRYRPAATRAIALGTAALFAVTLVLAFLEFAGVMHGNIFGSGDAYNGGLGSRPVLWHGAFQLWKTHPLLGIGPGNFELLISKYAPGVHTHANSIYFQTLAEQGILGAIALAAVIAASIVPFLRQLREPLALGACIAAVAMSFHQVVDCLWIYPKVGVLFWIILAAGSASIQQEAAQEHNLCSCSRPDCALVRP